MPLAAGIGTYSHSGETADWPLAIRRNRFILGCHTEGKYRIPGRAHAQWFCSGADPARQNPPVGLHRLPFELLTYFPASRPNHLIQPCLLIFLLIIQPCILFTRRCQFLHDQANKVERVDSLAPSYTDLRATLPHPSLAVPVSHQTLRLSRRSSRFPRTQSSFRGNPQQK